MRIAFVLPAPARVPQGGPAVVYRHGDGLAERGHDVTVIAPRRGGGVGGAVRHLAVRARDRWHGVDGETPFHPARARMIEPETLAGAELGVYDAVIATGYQTAHGVHAQAGGAGVYFVQGDERTLSRDAEGTWALPMTRVAVSAWLARTVEAAGYAVAGVVPNAVDPDVWGCDVAPERRGPRVVALYHRHPVKGPTTLVRALDRLRERVPAVSATVVAARPPSHRLPRWADLHVRPSRPALRGLYNQAAVCLHTSTSEGWGLVPMEAAACGCAVVATASGGPREYLTPGRSMVEVGVGDAEALAAASARLFADGAARSALAQAARADVARFSWAESTAQFESLLLGRFA